MALIGKIRSFSGILVISIGVAMVGFILQDLLTQNTTWFGNKNIVGIVAGDKLTIQEFDAMVKEKEIVYRQNTGNEPDGAARQQIIEQTWNDYVNQKLLGLEAERLGYEISGAELYSLIAGNDPSPIIKQIGAFTDSTGQFNINYVRQSLQARKQSPELDRQWTDLESFIFNDRMREKFSKMASGGMVVSKENAKDSYLSKNRKALLLFLNIPYFSIGDSLVKTEEPDIKKYYNEHKELYKQENEERVVEYVVFNKEATVQDTLALRQQMQILAEQFKTTTNDSDFVSQNSESNITGAYFRRGELQEEQDSLVFHANAGDVMGPLQDGNKFVLIKVLGFEPDTAVKIHARHILIRPKASTVKDTLDAFNEAKKLLTEIKTKGFVAVAKEKSEDFSNRDKGGDLGWFGKDVMVKPFEETAFKAPIGKTVGPIKTTFGSHLVEVIEKETRRVKIAKIEKTIEASTETENEMFRLSDEFASKATDSTKFTQLAEQMKLIKRVTNPPLKATDKNIPGITNAGQIIRWAFDAKRGEVSEVFTLEDRFVIAYVSHIRKEGYKDLEDVRALVKAEVLKQKKAEYVTQKLSPIMKEPGATLETIQKAWGTGANLGSAPDIAFSNFSIPRLGNEPKVLGTIFNLQQGKISNPIAGNNGVYIVVLESINEPQTVTEENYLNERFGLMNIMKSRIEGNLLEVLKKKAEVKDERYRFY